MKKLLYSLILVLALVSPLKAQWLQVGNTLQRTADGKQYRFNLGSPGFAYWYTKAQVDSLSATYGTLYIKNQSSLQSGAQFHVYKGTVDTTFTINGITNLNGLTTLANNKRFQGLDHLGGSVNMFYVDPNDHIQIGGVNAIQFGSGQIALRESLTFLYPQDILINGTGRWKNLDTATTLPAITSLMARDGNGIIRAISPSLIGGGGGSFINNMYGLNTVQALSKISTSDSIKTPTIAARNVTADSLKIGAGIPFYIAKSVRFPSKLVISKVSGELTLLKSGGGIAALNGLNNDSPGLLTMDYDYTGHPNDTYYIGGKNGKGYIGFLDASGVNGFNWVLGGSNIISFDKTGWVGINTITQSGSNLFDVNGSIGVSGFTNTGTTTLATSLTGILKTTSGVVSTATSSDYQVPITLTTTGSSGASTFNPSTGALNIPNYIGGFTNPMTTIKDIIIGGIGGIPIRLATGASNTVFHGGGTYASVNLTTDVSGLLPNANLANSAITLNGTPTSLGGSFTVTKSNTDTTTTGFATRSFAATLLSQASAVSTYATIANLALKAPIASPTFTGIATTPNFTWSSGTAGSVWFGGTGGALSQDNSNFFYNSSTHKLSIGSTSGSGAINLEGSQLLLSSSAASTSPKYMEIGNTSGDFVFGINGNASFLYPSTSSYAMILGTGLTTPMQFLTTALVRMNIGSNGNVGIGASTSPSGLLNLNGNVSATAWGLNGINLQTSAATYTNTSTATSGTTTNTMVNTFGVPTLAATNTSVTTTNAATVYIAGAPAAGTNMTITNPYALQVAAGNTLLSGNLNVTGTTTLSGLSDGFVKSTSGVLSTTSAIPQIVGTANLAAQTGSITVSTVAVGTATATFDIGTYLTVTTTAAGTINVNIAWTDQNNNAANVNQLVGISGSGLGSYSGTNNTIRAKNGTNIIITTTVAGATPTYDVGSKVTLLP